MNWLFLSLAVLGLFFSNGIVPFGSGGTMRHKPPLVVESSKPTELWFELRIVGEAAEGASVRYTDEKVYFRTNPTEEYKRAKCVRSKKGDKLLLVQATIPPMKQGDGTFLEYYMTVRLDGYSNSIGSPSAPKTVTLKK